MERLGRIAVWILALGAVALVAASVLAVNLWMGFNGPERRNDAALSDFRQFFEWSQIHTPENHRVTGSFISRVSPTGDHLTAVCLEVKEAPSVDWMRIRELDAPFREAVVMAVDYARQEASCIPNSSGGEFEKLRVNVHQANFYHFKPNSVSITLIDPDLKVLYLISFKV